MKDSVFDRDFRAINVDYSVAGNSSWSNYRGFLVRVRGGAQGAEGDTACGGGRHAARRALLPLGDADLSRLRFTARPVEKTSSRGA